VVVVAGGNKAGRAGYSVGVNFRGMRGQATTWRSWSNPYRRVLHLSLAQDAKPNATFAPGGLRHCSWPRVEWANGNRTVAPGTRPVWFKGSPSDDQMVAICVLQRLCHHWLRQWYHGVSRRDVIGVCRRGVKLSMTMTDSQPASFPLN
jgi:hypothetical protein